MRETRKNRLPKTKSPEEWHRFFSVINCRYDTQARNHAALRLMYAAGLRVGECLSLHVEDLDRDRMRVHVRDGKSGERNVPLPDDPMLMKSIERWLAVRSRWSPESGVLFVTKSGKPLSTNAIRESMKTYATRAGIDQAHPHMLRHSCATELLANGASPLGVQRVLGHARLSTTIGVYAHACDTHAAQAMLKR